MTITIEQIKKDLTLDSNTHDTLLADLIKEGKVIVETIAGRRFFEKVADEVLTQDFYKLPIIIKNAPYKDLVVKMTDTNNDETTLVEGTDYEDRNGVIYLLDTLTPKKITIEYKLDGEFLDLEAIVSRYVKRVFKKRQFSGEKSTSTETGTTSWEDNIPEEDIKIIRRYFGGI